MPDRGHGNFKSVCTFSGVILKEFLIKARRGVSSVDSGLSYVVPTGPVYRTLYRLAGLLQRYNLCVPLNVVDHFRPLQSVSLFQYNHGRRVRRGK